MNDVQYLRDQIDRLDTGLPDRPDVPAVVAAGRRRRYRRRALGAGVAAAALAVAGPVAISGLRTSEPGAASEPAPARVAVADFGAGMRAAVADAVPEATFTDDLLADGFTPATVNGGTVYEWSVHTPPHWATLFTWQQHYTLPSGAGLEVTSSWMPPTTTDVSPDFQNCEGFVPLVSCQATVVDGGRLLVRDGLQYDAPDEWYREVSLVDPSGTRGMLPQVRVSASVSASSWAQAQAALPPVAELTDLAQQPALVLPAPEEYPPFPAD